MVILPTLLWFSPQIINVRRILIVPPKYSPLKNKSSKRGEFYIPARLKIFYPPLFNINSANNYLLRKKTFGKKTSGYIKKTSLSPVFLTLGVSNKTPCVPLKRSVKISRRNRVLPKILTNRGLLAKKKGCFFPRRRLNPLNMPQNAPNHLNMWGRDTFKSPQGGPLYSPKNVGWGFSFLRPTREIMNGILYPRVLR